jgi:hypothetical protein
MPCLAAGSPEHYNITQAAAAAATRRQPKASAVAISGLSSQAGHLQHMQKPISNQIMPKVIAEARADDARAYLLHE